MKGDVHSALRKNLAKQTACYILITCQEPASDGVMQVQMSYEGDATLAAYLLQGAQKHFDEDLTVSDDDVDNIHVARTAHIS